MKRLYHAMSILFFCFTAVNAKANPLACGAIICLSNIPGAVPVECTNYRYQYFILQVWTPYFNGPATALLRSQYLMSCPFAASPDPNMTTVLSKINTTYGMLVYDPGT